MTDFKQLQRQLAAQMGFPSYTIVADLSAAQRAALANATAAYIVAHPSEFNEGQVIAAQNLTARGGVQGPDEYTFLDAAGDALIGAGQGAHNVVTGVAGTAGAALDKLGINLGSVLKFAVVAGVVWFGAPYVLPRIREVFKK